MSNVYYGAFGWTAETSIPLGFDQRTLKVTTMKRYGGNLGTTARVVQESGREMVTYQPFSDFNVVLDSRKVRCTEKAVRDTHTAVLANVEATVEAAKAHYRKEGAKA